MSKRNRLALGLLSGWMALSIPAAGQNPIIRDQFSADPTARVFGGKLFLFPSHDILAKPGKGRVGWFCMEDYHVFSSSNLLDWQDHGVVVSQTTVPWTDPAGYSMWAPDCIERKGKYYFYFPAGPKSGRGFNIGVAVAAKPEGPYVPAPTPIKKAGGIDPNVFIDKSGQAYLYWAGGNFYGAKLKDSMVELASDPVVLKNFPSKGLKEGPFLFERNGIYYMTYPHVDKVTERLEYAMSNSPLGPFTVAGVLMDEIPGCWTNHQSVVQYKKQWYLFYHHNDYSPDFDKARSVRVDYLNFNPDGTIQKVVPTLRGVGIMPADRQIKIDRYSKISDSGISIDFLNPSDTFKGWKTTFSSAGSWLEYDRVDFGRGRAKQITVRSKSAKGGTLQIRVNGLDGPIVAEVSISPGETFTDVAAPVLARPKGIRNLFVLAKEGGPIEVQWVRFQ
jgi:hypothetical protein